MQVSHYSCFIQSSSHPCAYLLSSASSSPSFSTFSALTMTRAILILLAIALIPAAFGLQCYICNNFDNKSGCGHGKDGKDDRFLKDCNNPAENPDLDPANKDKLPEGAKFEFCRKIVTSIEFNVNNNTAQERITRKCGYLSSKYDEECYYRGGFGGRQRTCSCKTDGCNGAWSLSGSGALLTVAVGVVYAITKF